MIHKQSFYERFIKRLLDLVLSSVALVLLSPVLLITAILVRINLGTPVIFKQERPGKNGQVFMLYKFRSMINNPMNETSLSDEKRLTPFGQKLRSTSLDELPELWNILRGDMSIVGPRPLLVKYLPLYNEEQKHRHDVRPGLTGWAQVHGRNALSWEEKFRLDVWYVEHLSFWIDVKTVFLTVKNVLCREGISSGTAATMEEFRGSKES